MEEGQPNRGLDTFPNFRGKFFPHLLCFFLWFFVSIFFLFLILSLSFPLCFSPPCSSWFLGRFLVLFFSLYLFFFSFLLFFLLLLFLLLFVVLFSWGQASMALIIALAENQDKALMLGQCQNLWHVIEAVRQTGMGASMQGISDMVHGRFFFLFPFL